MSAIGPKRTSIAALHTSALTQSGHFNCVECLFLDTNPTLSLGGIASSSLEISEPLSNWELAQEATERKRLREMDDAFCAALAAAIKRGKEKGPSAKRT
jgi:hypothetical protein